MSRFIILLGGKLVRTPRLDAQIAGARVIAADGGMRHAATLGVTPELWVGDFDSVAGRTAGRARGRPAGPLFRTDKDKTDGELAVAEALARGATSLVLAGAFGGARADHAFLHRGAGDPARQGRHCRSCSPAASRKAYPLLPGSRDFDFEDGTLFSILGFSHLSGVSVMGAKWPLDSVEVPFGSSLTLSNEVRGDLAHLARRRPRDAACPPYPGEELLGLTWRLRF